MAQLGARLDGIEEVVGSNPIGSTKDTNHVLPVVHSAMSKHERVLFTILRSGHSAAEHAVFT